MGKFKSFVFYDSFLAGAKHLSDVNMRCAFYEAIMNYGLDDIEPDFSMYGEMECGLLSAMFSMIKEKIDDGRTNKHINETNIEKGPLSTQSFTRRYLRIADKVRESHKDRFINELQAGMFARVDFGHIKEKLKKMDYKDFLKTPYWAAISKHVKYLAGNKCEYCGSSEKLEVHHKTYENHGDELHHLEDLVCLCHDCHAMIHKKRNSNKTTDGIKYYFEDMEHGRNYRHKELLGILTKKGVGESNAKKLIGIAIEQCVIRRDNEGYSLNTAKVA